MLAKLFPRSFRYDKEWVKKNSLGENVLFNTESLSKALGLKRGMNVIDLGCGNAISSIFLAKEFGCRVWAVDSEVPVQENLERIRTMHAEALVVPVQCDSWHLPFPKQHFDAIVAIDSYMYYGTDPKFLPYVLEFLKPGGVIGVLDACFKREVSSKHKAPHFLRRNFLKFWRKMHSVRWWRRLWEDSGLVTIITAEPLAESAPLMEEYVKDKASDRAERPVIEVLKKDRTHFIELFRMIARKKRV